MKKRSALSIILVLPLVFTILLPVFADADGTTSYAVVDRTAHTMTFCIGTQEADGIHRANGDVVSGDSYYTDFLDGGDLPWWDDGDIIEYASFLDPIEPSTMCDWFMILPNIKTVTGLGIVNTDRLTDLTTMFDECEELTYVDMAGFRAPLVESFAYMFMGCTSLETLIMDGFQADVATNADHMFAYCSSLKTLDMTGFGGANITDMSYMFCGCTELEELILDGFCTDSATSVTYMFANCSSLRSLDLSECNFRRDTYDALNMNGMFAGCTSLRAITLAQGFVSYRMGNVEQLPDPPADYPYTGLWIRKEYPNYPLDSDGLLNCYDGTMNSRVTWVWQQEPQSLAAAQVSGESRAYTGEALETTVTVTLNGETLEEDFDYTVSYDNNINAGSADFTVTGKNFYFDSVNGTFEIEKRDISAVAAVTAENQTFSGSAIEPAVTVMLGDALQLSQDTDYEITGYDNNVDAGTATVTVAGKGNYTGTASGEFTILKKNLTGTQINVDPQTYTGSAIEPTLTAELDGQPLVADRDYEISGYQRNINAGTGIVMITGKGNYTGTAAAAFTILEKDLGAAVVTAEDQTFAGSAIEPAVTVELNGSVLVEDRDFTVTFTNNTDAGTATVTVTGVGNYTGTASGTFEITPPSEQTKPTLLEWLFNLLRIILNLLRRLFNMT